MKTNRSPVRATRLPLDLRDRRAPESLAARLWRISEPHRYFWTPALFTAVLFCGLLLANFVSWRV